MKCASCGTENPENARFCSGCGVPFEVKPPTCPACGVEVLAGARFCHGCGADLAAKAAAPTTPKPDPKPAPRAGPEPATNPRTEVDPAVIASMERTKSDNWRPGWTFETIPSQPAAVAMCRIGVFACGLLAVFAALASFAQPQEVRILMWGGAAVYAVSAFGLWRHQAWAGLLGVAFYGVNIIAGLVVGMVTSLLDQGLKGFFLVFLLYFILPMALISGLRGALAWARFERAKATGVAA
jgi:hypothetical protein